MPLVIVRNSNGTIVVRHEKPKDFWPSRVWWQNHVVAKPTTYHRLDADACFIQRTILRNFPAGIRPVNMPPPGI